MQETAPARLATELSDVPADAGRGGRPLPAGRRLLPRGGPRTAHGLAVRAAAAVGGPPVRHSGGRTQHAGQARLLAAG